MRLGLYGADWLDQPLSTGTQRLYGRAVEELQAHGAVLVDDPFHGSGFAALRKPTTPLSNFDARGVESVPNDLHKYLERLGPNAAVRSFDEFAQATAAESAFGPKGMLGFMHPLSQFVAYLQALKMPPDLSDFIALKERYLQIVDEVSTREWN